MITKSFIICIIIITIAALSGLVTLGLWRKVAPETPARPELHKPLTQPSEIAADTKQQTTWLLLHTDRRKEGDSSIWVKHLLGLKQILSTPRPRGRIVEMSIDMNYGAQPPQLITKLLFHTQGMGAVIDATILQKELAGGYDPVGKLLKSAHIINAEDFPELPDSAAFILPVRMELTGRLSAKDIESPDQLFAEGILLNGGEALSTFDSFLHQLGRSVEVNLHTAPPRKISPLDNLVQVELSLATAGFHSFIRLIYILEHELGARVEQISIVNDLAESPLLRGTISAVFNITEAGRTDKAYDISQISIMLSEQARTIIPETPWDLISGLDGPEARLEYEASEALPDPGRPNWTAAEDRLMVRTTRRDERGRTVLVTTIGNAAENEVLSLRMGYWLYRWRVHSITMTSGSFERLDAQPQPVTVPLQPRQVPQEPPKPF